MHYHSESLIRDLSAKAQMARIQVLKMVHAGQTGHLGGAFPAPRSSPPSFSITCAWIPSSRIGPTGIGSSFPKATPAPCSIP